MSTMKRTGAALVLALAVGWSAGAALAAADPVRGAKLFDAECGDCHAAVKGVASRKGPTLFGLFGRKTGTVPGFDYTDANKAAGWVWDEAQLARYLPAPRRAIPGTTMRYPGMTDPKDIGDVVAYLAQQK